MKRLVILPTYNESKNIISVLSAINDVDKSIDILVIDDNSPDKTAELVKQFDKDNLFLEKRSKKMGLGTAYIFGFEWAILNNYQQIVQMDSDFSHDPKEIPLMLNLLEKNDLVIGSRYNGGLRVINWPIRRLYLSYFANFYARVITGVPISDLTAGYRAWKVETLKKINIQECLSQGYCFQIETAFRAYQKNCKLIEHPIVFTDRTVGESKMSRQIVLETIFKVWLFGIWRIFGTKK
jgi:dolichol-phosphate mannosyltransferase